ncbi:GNAT family N-acetyltransferase [Bacillus clarus]|uniref:GNAT family N-acetyltransferase n=1 Tax=Bacillus clarus TaxID=2338372 RepID=UPI0035BC888A
MFATVFIENPGSWRIMEKIGMKHEGTLKQHVIKWNKPMDLTCFGILREDYEKTNF